MAVMATRLLKMEDGSRYGRGDILPDDLDEDTVEVLIRKGQATRVGVGAGLNPPTHRTQTAQDAPSAPAPSPAPTPAAHTAHSASEGSETEDDESSEDTEDVSEDLLECEECGREFRTGAGLASHMRTHEGD